MIVDDFNTTLSPKDMLSRQKPNKEILEHDKFINKVDLPVIYRTFSQTQNIIPSSQNFVKVSPKLSAYLGHKSSLYKYKKIEIIPCILPGDHGLKLVYKQQSKE